MNTYIQDKLDELIKTYRKENVIEGSRAYFTEYDARMVAERLATDYHNHIVEKIEGMKLEIPEYRNKRGHHTNSAHMKIRHNKALQMVQSLLQDTNPKE